MKPLGLFLQNYGSFFGRHFIDLSDRGLCSVLGENLDDPRMKSNGAGKSTLVDAVDWCLWGECPRGDTSDSVVNEEAGKALCVTMYLRDELNRHIQITRLRDYPGHPNGPQLYVDKQALTALDAKETQKKIEQLLGMDREVFHAVVLFAQEDDFNFADATDAKRKEILTRIIPEMAAVDRLNDNVAFLLKTAENAVADAGTKRSSIQTALEMLSKQNPEAESAQWEQERNSTRSHLEAQLHSLSELRAKLAWERQELGSLAPIPPPPHSPHLANLQTQFNTVVKNLSALEQELAVARAAFKSKESRREALVSSASKTCIECGQPVTQQHAANEIAKLVGELNQLVLTGTALSEQVTQLKQSRDILNTQVAVATQDQQAAMAQYHAQCAVLHEKAKHAAHLDHHLKTVDVDGPKLQNQLHQLSATGNPFLVKMFKHASEMSILSGQLPGAQKEELDAIRRRDALKFWEKGFGPKGLKSYVLDGRVAEMTAEANVWVKLLTGGTTWVEFTTQREVGKGASKKLVEDLSIHVHRSNTDGTVTTRNYRSWSGGEKYRITLGINFGLTRLVAKRAEKPWDILFLDEVFQKSLDGAGKEAVAELLQHLGKERSSIFVIDHDTQFQSMFDEQLLIRRKNRRSRVVGGVHYGVQPGATEGHVESEVLSAHPAFPKG